MLYDIEPTMPKIRDGPEEKGVFKKIPVAGINESQPSKIYETKDCVSFSPFLEQRRTINKLESPNIKKQKNILANLLVSKRLTPHPVPDIMM